MSNIEINDQWIISKRGKKNKTDPYKPYAFLVEKELTADGEIEDTAVIFLTNCECPFHCLMCDLWKNTTDKSVPVGAIPKQIEYALNNLPSATSLKIYNSGSFFDTRAIPPEDYESIAKLAENFKTVIVENHPKLINEKILLFKSLLKPQLQIALGLEIADDDLLKKLNKKMRLKDFEKAVHFLKGNGILSRAFILLKPPFLSEEEGVYQAKRSLDFAYNTGVECCTVIPVRGGNGAMEYLMEKDQFSPPLLKSLEEVIEYGIGLKKGRVFADTWDLKLFSDCKKCFEKRKNRLIEINLTQKMPQLIKCGCNLTLI